jgi:plasmid stability protein
MEDATRDILHSALSAEPARAVTLVVAIRARFEPLGGIELEPPPRGDVSVHHSTKFRTLFSRYE